MSEPVLAVPADVRRRAAERRRTEALRTAQADARADADQNRPSPRRSATPSDRRTIVIQGRGAERHLSQLPDRSRRPSQRRYERAGFRPDRAALWAFLLGLMLILAAAASAHAAILHP